MNRIWLDRSQTPVNAGNRETDMRIRGIGKNARIEFMENTEKGSRKTYGAQLGVGNKQRETGAAG